MADADGELGRVKAALRSIQGALQVYTNWPKSFDALPCVLLTQAGESPADFRDDAEYLTEIEWYVRVFGSQETPHRAICKAVQETMTALGYQRTFRWDEGAADVRQTVFRFITTI